MNFLRNVVGMTAAPELLIALPILEAVFHRRSYDQASSFSYHNHILQGPFLRYLLKPLKPKNIGSFRFSLVQGKNNGKLSGIRLHSSSEVTATSVLIDGGVFPTNYLINVSGVDPQGNEAKWQLAMPSEEVQRQWLDALKKACEFGENDSSGECENLRDLAKKMKEGVGVRRRIHLFKLFPRCFVGRMAVRWIKKELNCTVSQAVSVGNKMVSYGLFHHVTHSHIFSDDKLLYRFSVEIDPLAIDSTAVDEVFLRGDAEATKLMDTLRKGNQELKATRSALSIIQVKYDDLLELWESASLKFDELQQSMRYVDYSFMAAQVLILLVVVAYYYFDNSSLVNALLTVAIALAIHVNVILGRGFGIFFSLKTSRTSDNIALPALAESPEYTSDNEFEGEGEGDGVEGDLSFDNYEYDTEDDDDAMGDLDADDPSTPNAVGWQGMATGFGSAFGANSYPPTRRPRGYSWSGGNLPGQGLAMAEKLPNNPILVRRCPRMLRSDLGEEQRAALSQPLTIHTVDPNHAIIDIDSDLFVGKAYMVVADVPGAPAAFFRGKRRKFEVVIQGRFKRLTPFSSVYTGQVYDEPLHQLANQWSVVRASLQILSILQPANRVCLKGAMPYVLSPLASTAQNIVVSRPGQEPPIHRRGSPLVEEDMRILGAKFVNPNSKRRKAYFSKRNNLQNYSFDPSLVYTFDFYQHMINLSTFQVDLGFMKYDIIRAIGPRPVQIMALCWDAVAAGTARPSEWPFLYNLEVWHRRALQGNTSEDTDSSKKRKN